MLLPLGSVVSEESAPASSSTNGDDPKDSSLPFYSLEEINLHDDIHDCWIILFDKVYDITDFIQMHPGGESVLLESAGRDASFVFLSAGHGQDMMTRIEKYLVGRLPRHQLIWQPLHSTEANS